MRVTKVFLAIGLIVTIIGMSASVANAQDATKKEAPKKETKAKPAPAKKKRAPNPAMQPPKEIDPKLPNVLLIGDSISIGYTLATRAELKGEANVFRPPTNCGPTTRGVESIEGWLGDRKWDVIHFNFGLHDLKYMGPKNQNLADPAEETSHQQVPPDQYAANLKKIALRLKKTGATVIWRETTPVPKGAKGRVVGDSKKYNDIAAKVMTEIGGIETDPMYDYAIKEVPQLPKNVHYSKEGSAKLAKHAAKSIRAALASKSK